MNTIGTLIPVAIVILIVLLLAELMKGVRRLPVEAKPLMTAIERRTIVYLEQAMPRARVHAQVCMGAIICPKRGLSHRDRLSTRGRFSQKIIDYVLEDRASGRIIALVELDDRSHNAANDARRDAITRAAGYLTIRLSATRRPDAYSVREAVHAALAPPSHIEGPAAARRRPA